LDTNDVEHPGSYGGKVPLDEDVKDVYDADSKSVDECCELEQLVLAIVVDHAENEEHDKDQSIDDGWPGDSHDEKSEKHNLVDVNNQYVKALVKELDHGLESSSASLSDLASGCVILGWIWPLGSLLLLSLSKVILEACICGNDW
jgi:hypothetical protein